MPDEDRIRANELGHCTAYGFERQNRACCVLFWTNAGETSVQIPMVIITTSVSDTRLARWDEKRG